MRTRPVSALLCAALLTAWSLVTTQPARAGDKDAPPKSTERKESGKDVFGLTCVHDFHLEISAKDWQAIQPTGGMRFPGGPGGPGGFPGGPGGPGGPPGAPAQPANKNADVHKGSGFGMEFPWVHGDLTEDGTAYKGLGMRFKGNASYMASARGLKRNFKIDFNHYDEEQSYHGLKSINLNAGAMDPTKAREAISYAVFRAAGVPASRTAFARVTLTVPGRYDNEFLGVYTLVEQVSKVFLKDHFKSAKGLLLKPEGVRGLEYLGDSWEAYERRYNAKTDADKKDRQRLIDFARLVHRGGDEQFRKEIASFLDIHEFLCFVAANTLIVNLDSLFLMGHNYYIYLDPGSNKFVYIPWDLDLSLAGFPMAGTPEQQTDLSLTKPFAGENKLFDRLMAIKGVSEQYQKIVKELAATCFSKERLLQDLEAIERVTKEPLAKEKAAAEARKEGAAGFGPPGGGPGGPGGFGAPGGGMFGRSLDVRSFIEKRTVSIAAQLAGKSKGYVPAMGFGPGGGGPGGFGPPQPGQILPGFLQDMLRLTADQKKQLEALQKEVDGKLEQILTAEQKKQLKEMRERGPGGFGPPPNFGPGGPPMGPPDGRMP